MKKNILLILISLITCVILTACSSPDASNNYFFAEYDDFDMYSRSTVASAPMAPMMEMTAAESGAFYDGGSMYDQIEPVAEPGIQDFTEPQGDLMMRKLVRNASLTVETEDFDILLPAIEDRVRHLGGYMENFNVSNNSRFYGGSDNRNAHMTIRIPANHYFFFMSEVAAITNVLERRESTEDVTLRYVDLESHKKVLTTEHDRLLELLGRAESIEDIILLEQRLSHVRYQIERKESQLRTFDNLVDFSTIRLTINEVKQYTPSPEQTVWEKISNGFIRSLRSIGDAIVNFFIWLITSIPYIIIIVLIVLACLLVVKFSVKALKKRNAKRMQLRMNTDQEESK